MNKRTLEKLADEKGTPFLIIDHKRIRRNYRRFNRMLPRVQAYYAVKANPELEIIKTLYKLGASFDVASLPEFNIVYDQVKHFLSLEEMQDFVWKRVIYANPVKDINSLQELNLYKPLVTYDSVEEMRKIKYHCPHAGVILRLKVDDKDSLVKFSNKFGIEPDRAVDLIGKTLRAGLGVEGLSFHVGSQCTNPEQFLKALEDCAKIFKKAKKRGYEIGETVTRDYPVKLVDIGGGFPVRYNGNEQCFSDLSKFLNREFDRLFSPEEFDIIAEPGRFIVANAGTLVTGISLAKYQGRKIPAYYIDDGIYHTFSGILYDHQKPRFKSFKKGRKFKCSIFGKTCDGMDAVAGENPHIEGLRYSYLPRLRDNDLIYIENMGAYTNASSTNFNGYPPAKVVHVNV